MPASKSKSASKRTSCPTPLSLLTQIAVRPDMFLPHTGFLERPPVVMEMLWQAGSNAAASYGNRKGRVEVLFDEDSGEVPVRDFGDGMPAVKVHIDKDYSASNGLGIPIILALSECCTFSSAFGGSTWTRRTSVAGKATTCFSGAELDIRGGTLVTFRPKSEFIEAAVWTPGEAARVLYGLRAKFPKITFTLQAVRSIKLHR